MEYLIYCDESTKRGKLFSNFYGGALVKSIHFNDVVSQLNEYKKSKNITGELKWTKVTAPYLDKYIGLMDVFFDLIQENKVKMRVMFQQNLVSDDVIRHFTKEEHEESYFKLYYQFIKHAFGLKYSNFGKDSINLRLYFDQFPDKKSKVDKFKNFIYDLRLTDDFVNANILIRFDDIVEVTSHDHVILQCADIVTGAMFFRLNKLHLEKNEETGRRGKRTIAKEKLYKHIHKRICEIRPNFNIGVSTSNDGHLSNKWAYPYSHWKFTPSQVVKKNLQL
ncbi:DUF3800 domain-containing protein [Bacillus haynesii]|uniref:DUF3800 domain-containing protein n=2 Tax=Bacillus haynesii TaxID=1925021 RepID=UPI0022805E6C|nr:DUF3800 domain-containing protein [Bacillus haynesii]MCY7770845.1 DUF3800 domain-containing protein [Bacillus haynesii]MCY7861212.1 DUF3800 domain-containing protein [Bacillus haynesii]MCY8012018.1 DUF3800 domain-containing protein [Bacillus haynesii]MCY8346367.1 DUF3800 domain-containing protein [Bacillus haynesii]MCY8350760.1 DUF3800 domain-containing protein [Bacillus haynesii]